MCEIANVNLPVLWLRVRDGGHLTRGIANESRAYAAALVPVDGGHGGHSCIYIPCSPSRRHIVHIATTGIFRTSRWKTSASARHYTAVICQGTPYLREQSNCAAGGRVGIMDDHRVTRYRSPHKPLARATVGVTAAPRLGALGRPDVITRISFYQSVAY